MKRTLKIVGISFICIIFMVSIFSIRGMAQGFWNRNTDVIQNPVLTDDLDIDENEDIDEVDEIIEEEIVEIDDNEEEIIIDNDSKKEEKKVIIPDGSKKVFLTFDDGPTKLTPKILDILKENDVQATFFTIGRLLVANQDIAIRAYEEGNMILPHSYSHNYAIYSTFETFYDDFYAAERAIEDVMGYESPPIFRFPGGSSNHSSFDFGGPQFMPLLTEDIKEKDYYYIDWNVSSGDAGPDYNDGDKMLHNIINTSKGKDFIVILFHDVDKNREMARILPEVIEYYRDNGYMFRTFKDITEEELDQMVTLKLSNKPIIR
ncbi:polysaccharide deacetylase family protein [Alkaliphilus peptidifermentans]|uniref:Peptidoglycan/xylan/chitin deacetylase, PgdA/CDA1 family n=1 Tax=Alkaliphilus peptidifermentans DSM 18978 TaxID=1120976 RepID=A0A1G5JXM6_9FIRM|nr:polysaccharide deacetylase family protein [Alkaliphilus peptidifermentans]SCY92528.1 Peptidoglycan/xylan/chitin deacetylase, PgdA/CDA1 family [Alkaliphilus peptidifermentans DSM 18978]